MSAQQKVTNEQVRKALEEWGGNLSAAADALGLRPKNLRERAIRLGIDIEALRAAQSGTYDPYQPGSIRMDRTGTPGTYRPGPHVSGSPYGPKSASGPFTRPDETSNVRPMQAAVATKEDRENEAPVRGIGGPAKPLRVRPPFQERVRQAKVDLIARHRIDTDEQHVFDQFCDEAFEPWLQSKLEPTPPPPTKKKGRGEKNGDPE